MLQANTIRQERERILEGLTKRHFPDLGIIDRILALDDDRRKYQASGDEILAEINRLSKQIGDLFKSGQAAEANALKEEVAARKETLKDVQEHQDRTAVQLEELLITVPNIPHSSVPEGRTPEDNEVFQDWTKPMPDLPPDAKPHWELAEAHGIIDFPLGVKITGSGFPLYRGKGASLQRALINFFLDEARQAGFEEIQPPLMVNADSARACQGSPTVRYCSCCTW